MYFWLVEREISQGVETLELVHISKTGPRLLVNELRWHGAFLASWPKAFVNTLLFNHPQTPIHTQVVAAATCSRTQWTGRKLNLICSPFGNWTTRSTTVAFTAATHLLQRKGRKKQFPWQQYILCASIPFQKNKYKTVNHENNQSLTARLRKMINQ